MAGSSGLMGLEDEEELTDLKPQFGF